MVRPRIEISQDQVEAFCRLNPTLEDAAAFFGCSEDTIDRRCKEWGYTGFADARRQNMVHTRLDLIRKAIKKVDKSDTMHKYCLSNLCGWSDKQENDVNIKMPSIKIVHRESEEKE